MRDEMPRPLDGLQVLDLSTRLGAYCGRLLGDLGASVVHASPVRASPDRIASFWAIGKQRIIRGSGDALDYSAVSDLIERCDIVITDAGPRSLRDRGLHPEQVLARHDHVVHVSITPYGLTGPLADAPATDLTLLAAGGLLYLAGDADRPPVRPFGEQSSVAASLHATIGALIASSQVDGGRGGQLVDVSAQECVAQATENAVQYLDCEGYVRHRNGASPREAGGGLFRCADGYVYVLSTMGGHDLSWLKVVEWLEEGGVDEASILREPEWSSGRYRVEDEAIETFARLFEKFAATRTKIDLYQEGQARGISVAPVSSPQDLLANPQLVARGFFREWDLDDQRVLIPGAPYRFASSEIGPRVPHLPWSARPAPPVSSSSGPSVDGPLAGLRIADFTWVGAGPFLTKPLGDHGADVIKVESRTRTDPIRSMKPFKDGIKGVNRSGYFANRNSSKRSICLDLKSEEGLTLARELIARSDVVVNNFSAGTMEGLGLGYADARALNPRIVYLDMPMQGVTGPHSGYRGFGLTIGALSGFLDSAGWADRPPVGTGTNYPDHVPNPLHGAIAILAALWRRRRTDRGEYIELSQLESTVNAIGPAVLAAQLDNRSSVRAGNEDQHARPHGVYPSRGDDSWVAIAVQSPAQWETLGRALRLADDVIGGRAEELDGEQLATIDRAIAGATAQREGDELAAELRTAGIPASVVNSSRGLLSDIQLVAREHWVTLDHPEMGPSVYDGIPYRLSKTPGRLYSPAPLLGEHTEEVCERLLGADPADYERWATEGKVG